MSEKVIDEKIVSMQFDNQHFEKNVKQSTDTLNNFKKSLRLEGSAKAAKSEFEAYEAGVFKFSDAIAKMWSNLEYEVAGKIKNLLKMFTTDPLKNGFDEYELKMNSVQTIMAGTGESIEKVNAYLNELNEYSDKTIYSFQDMTSNIGKFTNAGVKLDDAVLAIKGISNAAALSGANANEASRAMYNFSQALSTGYVQRIDWKSIELANMATLEFKEQLLGAAIAAGKVTKTADGMYKVVGGSDKAYNASQMFVETLDEQWLTTEVLVNTLKDYADETTDIGKRAFAAAQDVKTFSMMMDTLKEAAQSGWAQTWEIVWGNLEEAKVLWTGLSNFIGGFLGKMDDARNNFLKGVLRFNIFEPWQKVVEKLDKAGLSKITKVAKAYTNATEKVEYFQKVVDKVWRGDYKNSDTGRFELLEKDGYNSKVVQELVNLGKDHKLTIDDVKAAYKKYGLTLEDTIETEEELKQAMSGLVDEQLKKAGLTEDEIWLYKDLAKEAERAGMSMDEFVDAMSSEETNGRALLLKSFANIGKALVGVFQALKRAWNEIFPPVSVARVYNLIRGFEQLTSKLVFISTDPNAVPTETFEKLRRTFKGLLAVVDIVLSTFGGTFKVVFEAVKAILSAFDLDILDVTASLGDALVAVRDFIKAHNPIVAVFKKVGKFLKMGIDSFTKWVETLKKSDNIGRDIARGLIKGLANGAKIAVEMIIELGRSLIETIKDVLGIHSPSTEFIEIGKNIIYGLIEGLATFFGLVWKFAQSAWDEAKKIVSNIYDRIRGKVKDENEETADAIKEDVADKSNDFFGWVKEVFSAANLDKLLGIVGTVVLAVFAKKVLDLLGIFGNLFAGTADLVFNIADCIDNINKFLGAAKFAAFTVGLKNIALAVALLAASVLIIAHVATVTDTNLWPFVGIIAVLAAIVVGMLALITLIQKIPGKDKDGKSIETPLLKLAALFLSMGASLLLISFAMKNMASVPKDAYGYLTGIIAIILGATALLSLISKIPGNQIDKSSKIISKLGWSLLALSIAMKIFATLEEEDLKRVGNIVLNFAGLCAAIILLTKIPGGENVDKAAALIGKFGFALLALSIAMKLFSGFTDVGELLRIAAIVSVFMVICGLLIQFAKNSKYSKNTDKVAKIISRFGFALLMLSVAMRIMSGIKIEDAKAGLIAITIFGVIAAVLVALVKSSGEHADKAAKTISRFGFALLLLAGAMLILKFIKPEDVERCVTIVTIFGLVCGLLIGLGSLHKEANKAYKVISSLGFSILLLAVTLHIINLLPDVTGPMTTLISIMLMIMGFMYVAGQIQTPDKVVGILITLTVAIGIIGAILMMLSFRDWTTLIAPTIALTILMGMFAVLMGAVSNLKVDEKNFTKNLIMLAALVGVVAIMTILVSDLSKLDPTNAIVGATAVSLLLVVLVGMAAILGKIGKQAGQIALGSLALMVLIVAVGLLAAILILVKDLDPSQAVAMVGVLSLFTLALVGIAALLGLLGGLSANIVLGSLALMVLIVAVGLIAGILYLVKDLDPSQSIQMIGILALAVTGLIAISALLAAFSVIGTAAVVGAALLVAVFAILAGGIIGTIYAVSFMLPTIGDNLSIFTDKIQPFLDAVASIDQDVLTGVGVLASAVALLTASSLMSSLTNFGDWLRGLFGKDDQLTTLMKKLANAVVAFSDKISGKVDVTAFNAVADALNALTKVQDIDADKVSKAIKQLEILDGFLTSLSGHDYSGVKNLGNSLSPINKFASIDVGRLASAINEVKRLMALATDMNELDVSGMNSFGDALSNAAENGIKDFTNTFDDSTKEATDTVGNFVSASAKGIDSGYDEFHSSAGYLVSGFNAGIRSRISSAVSAAMALASSAISAVQRVLRINSPSKVFYEMGAYAGEGMIMAFSDYSSKAYDASSDMSNSATDGLREAISQVSSIIDSDMDCQPTIRPVLDLSEIETGSGYMSSLLNMDPSVSLRAKTKSIRPNLGQNGGFDVVSAIEDLGRKISGSSSGDTYNINGVTYDDGSNIASAIGEIVRAARVERRV